MSKEIDKQLLNESLGIPNTFVLQGQSDFTPTTLYQFTLSGIRCDGKVATEINHAKTLIFSVASGDNKPAQDLFEQAYSIGTQLENMGIDSCDLSKIRKQAGHIFVQTLLDKIERFEEGKWYLPRDTAIFLLFEDQPPLVNAQRVYLSGLSAGIVLGCEDRGIPLVVNDQGDFGKRIVFEDSNYQFIDYEKVRSEVLARTDSLLSIYALDPSAVQSIADLIYQEKQVQTLQEYYSSRVLPVYQGKKNAKVTISGTNNFLTSVWSVEYEDVYIDRAQKLWESIDQKAENNQSISERDVKKQIYAIAGRVGMLHLTRTLILRDLTTGRIPEVIERDLKESLLQILRSSLGREKIDRDSVVEKTIDLMKARQQKRMVQAGLTEPFLTDFIPNEFIGKELSRDRLVEILSLISPFDPEYLWELKEDECQSIFYRYVKALSLLADVSKSGGGRKLLRFIAENSAGSDVQQDELQKEISALVEYGDMYTELSISQRQNADRMEVLDEMNHFIRIVIGLKFEPRISAKRRLKVRDVNKQLIKMVSTLINKKLARGEWQKDANYPSPVNAHYEDRIEDLEGGACFSFRELSYPYVQSLIRADVYDQKEVSRFFMSLVLRYPLDIAVPVFLYTIYERFGEAEVNAAISQVYKRSDDTRELKAFAIGFGKIKVGLQGEVAQMNSSEQSMRRDIIPLTGDNSEIEIAVGRRKDPNRALVTYKLPDTLEIREAVQWNQDEVKSQTQGLLEKIIGPMDIRNGIVIDMEFFHMHADEPEATETQINSALIAQEIVEQASRMNGTAKVVGRPVLDDAHVSDRTNYFKYRESACAFGVQVPEIMFEGSPLQQWVGDMLARVIDPSKVVRRGNGLYFQVDTNVEIELYTGIGTDRPIQACVLNHIANDVYRLNPGGWNKAFVEFLMNNLPDIANAYMESGYASFEEYYFSQLAPVQDPKVRQLVKDRLFTPITRSFLEYLEQFTIQATSLGQESREIIRSVLTRDDGLTVITVQILERFFGEQGDKYKSLLSYLRSVLPELSDKRMLRVAYDGTTAEVEVFQFTDG